VTGLSFKPADESGRPACRGVRHDQPSAAGLLILAIVQIVVPLLAQGQPPNNADRMKRAIDSTAVLCANRFHLQQGERIDWIEQETANPVHQFVLARMAAVLASNGIPISLSPDPRSVRNRLSLTVVSAGISYRRAPSNASSDRTSIDRIAEVRVTGRMVRSDSTAFDSVSVRLEDRLRRSDLGSVERGGSPPEKPERPDPGFFGRVLQPTLIVASLGWMVYSFYSIRSQ
jgi:hypothetical protein